MIDQHAILEKMTGTHLTQQERSNLRIFRQVAAEAREALSMERANMSTMRIVDGFIENDDALARVRALCIPVRRSYLMSDPVNFNRVLQVIRRSSREGIHARAVAVDSGFEPLRAELESASILNDRRVTHAEMFEAWIDAMVFFEIPDKVRHYEKMLNELGRVVEGIGLHMCERIGGELMLLDDLVADFLGEPRAGQEAAEDESPGAK